MKPLSLTRTVFLACMFLWLNACGLDHQTIVDSPPVAQTLIDHTGPTQVANVILIIGDGMDDQQITMARNYFKGAKGKLTVDTLPIRSTVQVLTVRDDNPEQVVYVADSANSATAMATGIVTSRGRLATTASSDCDAKTIIELAEAAQLKTGIVSTASITDATPSAFIAHVSSRGCENPTMMKNAKAFGGVIVDCSADLKANGGLGSISEQISDSHIDIVLGGGQKHFQHPAESSQSTVAELAKNNGFYVINTAEALNNLPTNQRILGLFAPSHIPVELRGSNGRIAEKPVINGTDIKQPAVMRCESNPAFAAMPRLKQMTEAALGHLAINNSKGFFLTIESASIDKQSHARNTCGHIGEVNQLEEALQSALAFADKNPNTLVLVTADHGQAAQIIPEESLFLASGQPIYTPGHLTRLHTREGQIMAINYATNDFFIEEHTGVNIPLFANKVGKGIVPAMVTQPELFKIMTQHLGLPSSPDVSCSVN